MQNKQCLLFPPLLYVHFPPIMKTVLKFFFFFASGITVRIVTDRYVKYGILRPQYTYERNVISLFYYVILYDLTYSNLSNNATGLLSMWCHFAK